MRPKRVLPIIQVSSNIPQERGDEDKDFGIGYLDKAFTQMETEHSVKHGWNPLLARPLADLRVVLQDK